ncbi:MAG: hypothetical protein IT385_08460 [Deltaproteobacteria bacterium]|nr:hypothetical protein [Deltaproteobacteria bacterium]
MRSLCPPLLLSALALGCLETEPVDLGSDTATTTTDTGATAALETTTSPDDADVIVPVACLDLAPMRLDFAATLVGTVKTMTLVVSNCGDAPLPITAITLAPGSSTAFAITPADLPELAPGASHTIEVSYTPRAAAPIDGEGGHVRDVGEVLVEAGGSTWVVDLTAYGAGPSCPAPVITVAEGAEVTPGTQLHLSGLDSLPFDAPIVRWEWSVAQPIGTAHRFAPNTTAPSVTFTPLVNGLYTFRLEVTDGLGTRSCAPAELEVQVHTDVALRVELVWQTPGGGDGHGDTADLDLHLIHPFAIGPNGTGYFDIPYDAHWFNPSPNWGSFQSSDDDPVLVHDAVDDPGPEAIELALPEDDRRYCIGVHYWDVDRGHAWATVRIYLDGTLRTEHADVELAALDLWEVACVSFPDGGITPTLDASGRPKITHQDMPDGPEPR